MTTDLTYWRTTPIVGALSITTEDGTELHASSDVRLAELWAAHEYGDAWSTMTRAQRAVETAGALTALRQAHEASL
jgi:hypothetical protein